VKDASGRTNAGSGGGKAGFVERGRFEMGEGSARGTKQRFSREKPAALKRWFWGCHRPGNRHPGGRGKKTPQNPTHTPPPKKTTSPPPSPPPTTPTHPLHRPNPHHINHTFESFPPTQIATRVSVSLEKQENVWGVPRKGKKKELGVTRLWIFDFCESQEP